MKGKNRSWWLYALPVLLLLAVTLPHLGQGDFRSETAHYGAIGLQAWQQPASFWTLHEHPEVPYFNKPPLVFWIHGLFLNLLGISLVAVRLPSILAAAGCVLLTVSLARRGMGRATALTAGAILALSYEYFRRTREISLDLWQLLFMLAAIRYWMRITPQRPASVWLAGICLGLALLCKPLMALLIVPILLLWAFMGIPNRALGWRPFAILLGMALFTAVPWHLAMALHYGAPFLHQYFGQEVAARAQGLRNREPAWYYAVEIGRSYWPWMLCLAAGLVRWVRGRVSPRHRQTLTASLVWVAIWLLALTCFPDKRPRYALPLYPILAVLGAYGVTTLDWRGLRSWYRRGLDATAALVVALALAAALLPLTVQRPPDPDLAALTEWCRTQKAGSVYSASLTSSDESMIFLKAGYWPTPLRLHPRPDPGSFVIHADTLTPPPPSGAPCLFHRGPYRVVTAGSN